jgi:hypothetical protein
LTVRELARLALETLDAQRRYFRDRRPADLEASKALEKKLRRAAEGALDDRPTLFDKEAS